VQELSELVDEQYNLLKTIGLETDAHRLQAANTRLQTESFRVLITGEFSRGKTMLINALLGEDILASSLLRLPVVNVVRGGENRAAFAGRPDKMEEVAVDTIKEIKDVSRVELTWDAPFLQEDLEIVEYPSMSEAPDSHVFRDEVGRADLVVVVVACDSLYSNVEADIIETVIHATGHRKPLFVANFVDRITLKDLEDVKRAALVRLPVNNDRIFFVSAQNALDGDTNEVAVISSLREKILEEAANRKAIKTARVRQLITNSLDIAHTQLDTAIKNASAKKKQAEGEINVVHDSFRELQDLQSRIQRDLNEFRDGTRDVLQGKIETFVQELALKVEDWGREYKGSDLVGHLNKKLKEALIEFSQQDFSTYLQTRLKEQEDLLSNSFTRYRQQLNKLYDPLQENAPDVHIDLGTMKISPELREVNVTEYKYSNNSTSSLFNLRSLVEAPEAILTLVGTIVGSIFFTKFAIILVPAGIGVTAFLLTWGRRTKYAEHALKTYSAQIREQAGRLEVEVIEQINAEIDNLQTQITNLLNSTTQAAQSAVQDRITELKDGIGKETESVTQTRLERIRAALDTIG